MEEDLKKSGLLPGDVDARPLEDPERAVAHIAPAIDGYVIPYYDITGRPLPFYRIRCFDSIPKYRQPPSSNNFLYFPKGFRRLVAQTNHPFVILTEGEKKAAKAIKEGFPCCALGGVDSWKTKTLILPRDTELTAAQIPGGRTGLIKAKLPSTAEPSSSSTLASGMMDLIDLLIETQKAIIIIYDSDDGTTKYEVQRAAAALAFELRHQGIPFARIRQVVLPPTQFLRDCKIGLDDYIVYNGRDSLGSLCNAALSRRSAFPRHPNVREFINKKLQSSHLSRKEVQAVGLAILSDMDARGRRLRSSSDGQLYYFDDLTRRLTKVVMASSGREIMSDTEFSRLLYQEYGISLADNRLMQWFATQFSAEDPVDPVSPYRVLAKIPEEDAIAYQINDGQYVKISSEEGLEILDNGDMGIMFESGHTQPLDSQDLLASMELLESRPLKMWWLEILQQVRLKEDPLLPVATALLYYLSPWLHRWRGTQLPIELVIGESGSGKSSLYELRLNILLGYPTLRNAPQDIKDWHASVAHSGGLHVTDNVQLVDKNLRQRLSDELCRIVTEPDPHIEMRKLYSDNELIRIPVTATFAITAITQPFLNADLLQRAIVIELDQSKSPQDGITFDSRWVEHQMARFGSRADWVAHHLLVLVKFFELAEESWDYNYMAKNRLINLEQAMIIMARVFGLETAWIPKYMAGQTASTLTESDWILQGIIRFVDVVVRPKGKNYNKMRISSTEIALWAQQDEEFGQISQLTNSRMLGKYLQSHKRLVSSLAGLYEMPTKINNKAYYWVPTPYDLTNLKKNSHDQKKVVESR